VDIDLLVTLLSPISASDNSSAESDALYWSLAKSGLVSLFWSDHEHQQTQQPRQTPSPQAEFHADLHPPLHTTPIEVLPLSLWIYIHMHIYMFVYICMCVFVDKCLEFHYNSCITSLSFFAHPPV
jgi:hypothetical protein